MTVSYSPRAFDGAHPLGAPRSRLAERDRLVGFAITLVVHGLIAVAALTAVQVVRPKPVGELSIQITPTPPKPLEEPKLLPKLAPPVAVTAPVPEVVVQSAAPPTIAAQAPMAAPVQPPIVS